MIVDKPEDNITEDVDIMVITKEEDNSTRQTPKSRYSWSKRSWNQRKRIYKQRMRWSVKRRSQ